MDEIRRYILKLIEDDWLSENTPDITRRIIVNNLLAYYPDIGKRNLRNRLNRALKHPYELRGGAGRGQGAPKGNTNRLGKKKG